MHLFFMTHSFSHLFYDDSYFSFRRPQKTADAFHQNGFSAAVTPDDAVNPALFQAKGNILQNGFIPQFFQGLPSRPTSAPRSASTLVVAYFPLVFQKPPYRPTQRLLWASSISYASANHQICVIDVLEQLMHKARKPSW